ncbi:ubiquitin-like-conjugating enzyme ATG10 [Coccinella septempunctata]|uniref:ubiquitin-like-conjugating enzyme ATG10 n=1 Tax=Coccinella septempunctata TaxID=41139 RepID=UPI001D07A701|nr:ubiquitin-like-conjugating enzyme ATG10 [Coccinella septempunctata]
MLEGFSEENFQNCVRELIELSDKYQDGWQLHRKEGTNSIYISKKSVTNLRATDGEVSNIVVTFEYHIAYHSSYGVPVLAFYVWKQDGTSLTLEEFWKYNSQFKNNNMYDTLTQLDHPVLQKPILTLHPCRTHEVIQPFIEHSKNLVISWLSTVGHFVYLELFQEYLNLC